MAEHSGRQCWPHKTYPGNRVRFEAVLYVDFLIRGRVMTSAVISGTAAAVGVVAEDSEQGSPTGCARCPPSRGTAGPGEIWSMPACRLSA